MAATADGGFLIADFQTARVRQVSPAGIITTVAGSTRGDSGDGGLATAARLDSPADVEVTPDGGFLLADFFEARVRRVSPAGENHNHRRQRQDRIRRRRRPRRPLLSWRAQAGWRRRPTAGS
jgi:hypothetical protein